MHSGSNEAGVSDVLDTGTSSLDLSLIFFRHGVRVLDKNELKNSLSVNKNERFEGKNNEIRGSWRETAGEDGII